MVEIGGAHPLLRPFVGVGLLGGYTTFSTYAVQAGTLLRGQHGALFLAYLLGTLLAAMLAVTAGVVLAPVGTKSQALAGTPNDPTKRSPTMTLHGTARRLSVYVGEDDTWNHRPLYTEIVHRAHRAGLAGASVLRGIEGYGSSAGAIHTSRILSLSEDLPVVVVIVDAPEEIDAFLPQVTEIVTEGLVTLDDVEVVVHRYRGQLVIAVRGGPGGGRRRARTLPRGPGIQLARPLLPGAPSP